MAGLVVLALAGGAAADRLSVFAAASLTDALTDALVQPEAQDLGSVAPVFAASSALARQIADGAPADLFVSANRRWIDWLSERIPTVRESAVPLVGNRLVLIAPARGAGVVASALDASFDMAGALGDGRLAIADPDHVPAGLYGRQALRSLGLWQAALPRLARASNVRAALVFVMRGETPLGVVYASDATAAGDRVTVVGRFPDESHAPIVYVAAFARPPSAQAKALLAYLRGPAAQAAFGRHGFTAAPAP